MTKNREIFYLRRTKSQDIDTDLIARRIILFRRWEERVFPRELTVEKSRRGRIREREYMTLTGARRRPGMVNKYTRTECNNCHSTDGHVAVRKGIALCSGAVRALSLFGKRQWRRDVRAKNQWGVSSPVRPQGDAATTISTLA